MTTPIRRTVVLLVAVATTAGCVSTGDDDTDPGVEEDPGTPAVVVSAPPERQTPFCEAMIDLSDELLSGEVDDSEALIIETYRSILDVVPEQISADFTAVLSALEAGDPPQTDPPLPVATTPATTTAPTEPTTPATGTGTTSEPEVGVDEGFAPGTSPSERINNYVDFACRGTANNPGPPATPPLEGPVDE
jgi:hypothetical protein